jgi:hypothetical protein
MNNPNPTGLRIFAAPFFAYLCWYTFTHDAPHPYWVNILTAFSGFLSYQIFKADRDKRNFEQNLNTSTHSRFNFDLPKELIAQYPSENRDESRLMVVDRKKGTIEHKIFKDVINYFDDGDVMILNNTKVFPARMYGNKEKTGARIEVFLLRELMPNNVFAMF